METPNAPTEQVQAPEAPAANSPEAPASTEPAEEPKPLPKQAPSYLSPKAVKSETIISYAQRTLSLSLPITMEKKHMLRAINAKLANHHVQRERAAQATPDPEAIALPPGEGGEPVETHHLPIRPERFPAEVDGGTTVKNAPLPALRGPTRSIGIPGRSGDMTARDSHPKLPEAVATLTDNPQFSHLTPALDEDGKLDPEVEASLSQLPKAMLEPPNKAFRHPQVCNWLYNPATDVYWYPTELLMRNEGLIPVMGEPPKNSVFGSLPPDSKKPPAGGTMLGV